MACKNCFKDNEELFIKSVTEFKSRRFLVECFLKIVLNIQQIWLRFCSCKKVSDRCLVCQFYAIYKEQQYKIHENSLNLDFLERFHSHTVRNLQILRREDSHIACELVNRPFFYNHKDWFTGEVDSYNILQCLDIFESDKIDNIKIDSFKIVLDKI